MKTKKTGLRGLLPLQLLTLHYFMSFSGLLFLSVNAIEKRNQPSLIWHVCSLAYAYIPSTIVNEHKRAKFFTRISTSYFKRRPFSSTSREWPQLYLFGEGVSFPCLSTLWCVISLSLVVKNKTFRVMEYNFFLCVQ